MADEQPRYMTDDEKRLARMWANEDGVAIEEIARRLRRNRSSIWELLSYGHHDDRPGVGRKPALAESDKDRLVRLVDTMVEKADVRWIVTIEMIQARFRPRVCTRVIAEALHERNVRFHRLRRKPILTDKDVRERSPIMSGLPRKTAGSRPPCHCLTEDVRVRSPQWSPPFFP